MVRLISIIKKGLKKAAATGPAREEHLPLPSEPKPRPAGSFETPPAGESPYRLASAAESAQASAYLERFHGLQELYRELHELARFTLGGAIARERTMEVVGKVADVFSAQPYNDLLLIAYSFDRRHYLSAHIANDVILSIAFARHLGYARADIIDIGICALTHDLGMAEFETAARKAHQLSSDEVADIKRHPLLAAALVRPVFGERMASVVADIHERENGQGYPRGVPGADIHMWAKVIAVADTFEALTHPRVFRAPYSPYEAIKMIIKKKDAFFDDTIVRHFIDFLSIYPVGSLVYLNTGEMALVTASNAGSPTRPVVRVLINERREVEELPRTLDLAQQNFVYISAAVEPEKEKEVLYFLKPRGQVELDDA